ncbi:hypothetical protein HAX54_041826, partial [Datura stramonium]|nr:hypothetical protein [Datura stramonium]
HDCKDQVNGGIEQNKMTKYPMAKKVRKMVRILDPSTNPVIDPLGREKALLVQDESKKEDKPIEQAIELHNDWKMNILTGEEEAGSRKIFDGDLVWPPTLNFNKYSSMEC